jgi:hypothetical protein
MKYWLRYTWLVLAVLAGIAMHLAATGHLYKMKTEIQNPCYAILMPIGPGCPAEKVQVEVDQLDGHRTQIISAAAVVVAVSLLGFSASFRKTRRK